MNNPQYSLDYIMNHRLLTHEEEKDLAAEIQKGGKKAEKAKQELVRCNMRLVGHFVSDYDRGDPHLRDDLIGEGTLGLLRAAEKYTGEYKFSTYATWWVRQKVFKHIRSLVKMPDDLRILQKKINKVGEKYTHEHGREPTIPEIRVLLKRKGEDCSEEQILGLFRSYRAAINVSLDEAHGEEGKKQTRLEKMAGKDANEEKNRAYEAKDSVNTAVSKLPKLERYLIEAVHFKYLDLREAAELKGIPYARAEANYQKALKRLRNILGENN